MDLNNKIANLILEYQIELSDYEFTEYDYSDTLLRMQYAEKIADLLKLYVNPQVD